MTPIKFSIKYGVTTFHYNSSELMKFCRYGFKNGDVGMILIKRSGYLLTYKGFGTIENPSRDILTMSIMHSPGFSGEMPADEERLIKPESFFTKDNTSCVILDFTIK